MLLGVGNDYVPPVPHFLSFGIGTIIWTPSRRLRAVGSCHRGRGRQFHLGPIFTRMAAGHIVSGLFILKTIGGSKKGPQVSSSACGPFSDRSVASIRRHRPIHRHVIGRWSPPSPRFNVPPSSYQPKSPFAPGERHRADVVGQAAMRHHVHEDE
jgi:hypothetical protein